MVKTDKQVKMSNRKFRLIVIPIITALLFIAILAGVLMTNYSVQMDQVFGRGDRIVDGAGDAQYYTVDTEDNEEAKKNGEAVSQRITDEAVILLKNDDLLPLERGSEVTPFGYGSTDEGFIVGGLFNAEGTVFPLAALGTYFTVNSATVEKMTAAQRQEIYGATGTIMSSPSGIPRGRADNRYIYEYDASIYEGTETSCEGTTGIVFISRGGNEGNDMKHDAYNDGTPHELALTVNERNTIRFAKEHCSNVVVVINADNILEISELVAEDGDLSVDAIVWMGLPGSRGCTSAAKVLCGELNPSGRTPDLYPVDFTKDPTYMNFGESRYNNITLVNSSTGISENRAFIEYEEGIYIGYRYYETRAAEYNGAVTALGETAYTGEDAGEQWYDANVVYPFGYGLSYSEYTQEITEFSAEGDEITVSVEVKNIGDEAGKETVQLYFSAPYDAEDKANGVEKAAWQLCAFAKTGELAAKTGSETVTFSFPKDELASYDRKHANGDGTTGCYKLTAGEYTIALKMNSHDIWTVDGEAQTRTFDVGETVYYNGDNPRSSEIAGQSSLDENGEPTGIPEKRVADPDAEFVAATNQFEELNKYMDNGKVTNMTRSNFAGTFPTPPTADDQNADEYTQSIVVDDFDPLTDPYLGNVKGSMVYTDQMPAEKEDNGLLLSNMRGLSYYDPLWEDLLDQLDYGAADLREALFGGAYQIGRISAIGQPKIVAHDGPQNWTESVSRDGHCVYPTEVVIAATWNTSLAYDMAYAITQEGMVWDYSCWYAPAVNLHRTPFCGRNFEYFSEDPLLSGQLAASQLRAAGKNGVFSQLKHFALNEMETNRGTVATWAGEQAIRELYLRAFEYPIKFGISELKYAADTNGDGEYEIVSVYARPAVSIMCAQNYLGGSQCSKHYGLLTGVVRNEWGFNGLIETDMDNTATQWGRDKMLRAGCDVWMMGSTIAAEDMDSATARTCIRNAVHHIAYTIANSYALNGALPGDAVRYATSPWFIVLVCCIVVVCVVFVAGAAWVILRALDERRHPGKYKDSCY